MQLVEIDVTENPDIAESYGVVSLPKVFVVDAECRPCRVNHGFVSSAELKRQLAPYLSQST